MILTNGVGEGDPQGDEDHPSPEVHASKDGTGEKNDSDCSEDELEEDHGRHWELGSNSSGRDSSLCAAISMSGVQMERSAVAMKRLLHEATEHETE